MKTLREVQQEREATLTWQQQARTKLFQSFEAMAIPLHSGTEVQRQELRQRVATDAQSLGIACDHCGTELFTAEDAMLMTSPPQCRIGCPGCNWRGFYTLPL